MGVFRKKRTSVRKETAGGAPASDEMKRVLAPFAQLTIDSANGLPWMAAGAVTSAIQDGALMADSPERAAGNLIVACQEAVQIVVEQPDVVEGLQLNITQTRETEAFMVDLVSGASEVAAAGALGYAALLQKAMPAIADGVKSLSMNSAALTHHTVTWFLLAVASGMSATPPTDEQMKGLNIAFAPPAAV